MIKITNEQTNRFIDKRIKTFRSDLISHIIKFNYEDISSSTRAEYIADKVLNLSNSCEIKKAHNIKKLSEILIEANGVISNPQRSLLEDKSLDEGYRVSMLHFFILNDDKTTLIQSTTILSDGVGKNEVLT